MENPEVKYRLEIVRDHYPWNPREWDSLGVMVCFYKRYNLGDEHDYHADDYHDWDDVEATICQDNPGCVILPLYLYDHGGLRMKVGSFMGLLPQGHAEFDSGQVGFIYVSAEDIRQEYGVQRISKKLRARVQRVLEGEVSTYDQWLCGDVWGFQVFKETICSCCGQVIESEVVKSCYGYYDTEHVKQDGQGMVDWYEKQQAEAGG